MSELKLLPILGMNNVARADNLKRENGYFVQAAHNVDIHADGRISLRQGWRKLFDETLRDVWQSPLHGDVFTVSDNAWGILDTVSGSLKILLHDVGSASVYHCLLNNRVLVSCERGLFVYDGTQATPLCIDAPAAPLLLPENGSLPNGTYAVAVSWLRGDLESGLSPTSHIDVSNGGLQIALPFVFDNTLTAARVYMTQANGGELQKLGDFALDTGTIRIVSQPNLTRAAENRFMQPMPSGKWVQMWRGRLITVRANVIYFSQALAYHWHDPRFDFVQLPQRITFVIAVENGLWVGQVSGVVFLSGNDMNNMQIVYTAAKKPITNSAITLQSNELGEISGGLPCAAWLAENGFVIGTATGQLIERHAGILQNIKANHAQTTIANRRIFTATQ